MSQIDDETFDQFPMPVVFIDPNLTFKTALSPEEAGESAVYVKIALTDTLHWNGSYIAIGVSTNNVVKNLD